MTAAKPGTLTTFETSSTTKSCAARSAPMPGCERKARRPSATESKSAQPASEVVAEGTMALAGVPGGGGARKGTAERKPRSVKALVTQALWKLSTSAAVGRPAAAESGRPGAGKTSALSAMAALEVLRAGAPKLLPVTTQGSPPSVLASGAPPAAPPVAPMARLAMAGAA